MTRSSRIPEQYTLVGESTTAFPELELEDWEGIRVCMEFVTHSMAEDQRVEFKRDQHALLLPMVTTLGGILQPDEVVVFVARGTSPYTILDYLSHLLMLYFVRRCVYVFTDRRVILIRVASGDMPLPSISALSYRDILAYRFDAGYGLTVNFKLAIIDGRGRRETFNRFSLATFELLQRVFPGLLAVSPPRTRSPLPRRRFPLCVGCASPLVPGAGECASCQMPFRSRAAAMWFALLVPGGGYFYTGHPRLGAVDALVEVVLFLNLLGLAVGLWGVGIDPYLPPTIGFASALLLEKAVSMYHAREMVDEMIPRNGWIPANPPRLTFPARDGQAESALVIAMVLIAILFALHYRIPRYELQQELGDQLRYLKEHRTKLIEKEAELETVRKSIDRDWVQLDRIASLSPRNNHRIPTDDGVPQMFIGDARLSVQYQACRRRLKENLELFREKERLWEAEADAYNQRASRANAIQAEIGDTWFATTPDQLLKQIGRDLGGSGPPQASGTR